MHKNLFSPRWLNNRNYQKLNNLEELYSVRLSIKWLYQSKLPPKNTENETRTKIEKKNGNIFRTIYKMQPTAFLLCAISVLL
jgi:hypothetical protein